MSCVVAGLGEATFGGIVFKKKNLLTAVTLPATPRLRQNCETQLRAVHFERAGLLDAEMMSFTPALRIDYNFYQITAVTITDSLSDGVHINYIHPYETARLEYMQVRQYTLLPHFHSMNIFPCYSRSFTVAYNWNAVGLCKEMHCSKTTVRKIVSEQVPDETVCLRFITVCLEAENSGI